MRIRPVKYVIVGMLAVLLAACGSGGASNNNTVPGNDQASQTPDSGNQPPATGDAPADARLRTKPITFETSDGQTLQAYLSSASDDYPPRPLIIEFTPYGPESFQASTGSNFGPAYNYIVVHGRGTGGSTGSWGALGPRDQQDVAEFVQWACTQPFSNSHIGLYGFSASAIAVYNTMHLPLACVDAAALMAGTADLYRDLIYPGGILNLAPASVVGLGVGAPLLANGLMDLLRAESPINSLQSGVGLLGLFADVLSHSTEDAYWRNRTLRPGPNSFPVLADTSFNDVEPRGPFQAFQALRDRGSHLLAFGAHDGFPANTPGPFPEYQRWFDHYLRGADNGIDQDPVVQLLIGNGSFEALKAGDFIRVEAADWPVPGTRWQPLYLQATRSGTALSINDGSLGSSPHVGQTQQAYAPVPSLATATDVHTTSTLAAIGAAPFSFGSLFQVLPFLTQTNITEPLALTYTTPPFSQPVNVVGPANLDVFISSLLPTTDLYAVVSDVWPDGSAHPVGVGRLRTDFPDIDLNRSLVDENGEVVQPYGYYRTRNPAAPGEMREYHVEFWPIGNCFEAGHRLRLSLVGTSFFFLPALPANVNLVAIGGDTPSRLLLPVLPGSDAQAAIAINQKP